MAEALEVNQSTISRKLNKYGHMTDTEEFVQPESMPARMHNFP